MFQVNNLEKQEQRKFTGLEEKIKFREEFNEIEAKKVIQMFRESKSWLFEKVNKTYRPFPLRGKKKEREDPK